MAAARRGVPDTLAQGCRGGILQGGRVPGVRALITGSGGQVGRALTTTVPAGIEILALNHADLDIADASSVDACVERFMPDVILNAAAYTAVDRAEQEPDVAR